MNTRKGLTVFLVVSICSSMCAGDVHAAWSSDPSLNNAICTAAGDQQSPAMIEDGSGGAIITWMDRRSGSDYDIYAQRISAGGAVQWRANGVAICTATGNQLTPTFISDGNYGAIITCRDRYSGNWDISVSGWENTFMAGFRIQSGAFH